MRRVVLVGIFASLCFMCCENKYPQTIYIDLYGKDYINNYNTAYFYGVYSSKAGAYSIEGTTPRHYITSLEDADDVFQISINKGIFDQNMYDFYTYLIVEIYINEEDNEKELIFKDSTNIYNDGFIITYP